MRDAVGPSGVVAAGDVVKVNKWIMADRVLIGVCERQVQATDILLIGFPGYPSMIQLGDEVVGCVLVVQAWVIVVEDSKVGTCFQPEVVWLAWVEKGWIEVLNAIGS